MQPIQFEIVREKTAIRDQTMFLFLRARNDLPQHQLEARFVPHDAVSGLYQRFEIFRSPANNQVIVIGPRSRGRLVLRGENADGKESEGAIDVNEGDIAQAAGAPAEAPERDGGRGDRGDGRRGGDRDDQPRKVEVTGSVSLNRAAEVATRGRYLRDAIQ